MTQNIHLIFKTHLDVGFTDLAASVVRNYFRKYIPAALRVAREMRDSGAEERFIWTTGSWLIYEYLEQASSAEKKEMEEAILAGDIAWHGLPFTTHTELMDAELFRFGLSLSTSLDARYGKHTTAAKMTDVPGHTRAIIPLLAEAGIKFLHIGVNPGSTMPRVPNLFRWKDEGGAEVMVMYESGYGSAFQIPGLEDFLAFGHTIDNMGPQTVEQVRDVYRGIRGKMPGANIFASTLSAFGEKLEKVRPSLPVLTEEIGDTWIHGVGSDPIKVSRFRELLRLRNRWLSDNKISYSDPQFFNFNRFLLLVPEHTWGMDEKTFLGDHENYSAEDFTDARGRLNFKTFESSWIEKRAYPQLAVNALEDSPLADEARQHLESIRPRRPYLSAWEKFENTSLQAFSPLYSISFDTRSGGIDELVLKADGHTWADTSHQLGTLSYQTFSAEDYTRFFNAYILPDQRHDWAREDFTKPGMENASPESRIWFPTVKNTYQLQSEESLQILFHLTFELDVSRKYGTPGDVYLRYELYRNAPILKIDMQWFNKKASRLPEALWFSFQPLVTTDGQWVIEKLGREISPLEVVENGNRHLHACGEFATYRQPNAEFRIAALDSPLVAPGKRSLLDFNNKQPEMSGGVHFCLLNNLWGTNFPMWFEEDCRFRYEIRFTM